MDEQFSHRRADELLVEVGRIFRERPVYRRKDRPVVFLCGGPTAARSRYMRRHFLDWSRDNLPTVVCLLAEDAFKHTALYNPPEPFNLSDFEQVVGEIADCILIFPESEGSFAELGLFSNVSAIRKKLLVANAIEH